MPWRSDLHPLHPDAERSAGSISPPVSVPLGVAAAPADAPAPPRASANPFPCSVLGCEQQRSGDRYCAAHDEAYRTRAYDLTRDVGRGEL